MSAWSFILTDLNGKSLGELRAFERSFNPGVSVTATASCRIRQDDRLWATVAAGSSMLKVYDTGGNLRLYGPIISDEEQADGTGAHVKITAADLSWELSRRYFAKDTTGVGVTYTNQDSGVIAFAALAATNADKATGITAGTTGVFLPRTVTYLWKRVLDALAELGAIGGGASYEWSLRYVDGTPPAVYLDLTPIMGSDLTTSVFLEYGTGKRNCGSYGRARTIDTQATRVFALGAGSTMTAEAFDTAAETLYQARREDVLSFGDISDASLLDALASAHVAIRKDPRQIVTLVPFVGSNLRYGVDYVIGDRLNARVVVNNTIRVNGAVRVWGAQIAISDIGLEAPTLALVPQ